MWRLHQCKKEKVKYGIAHIFIRNEKGLHKEHGAYHSFQDSLQNAIFVLLRGTSALEGMHQKLPLLLKGFSNSPWLLRALVSDYFLRWNQSIEIIMRGMPEKYDGFYKGALLEEEIDKLSMWPDRIAPPHPDWISTKSSKSTGETFNLIDPIAKAPRDEYDTDSDTSLNEMCEVAGDHNLETEATTPDTNETQQSLPPSAWWIAAQFGRSRLSGRVNGKEE